MYDYLKKRGLPYTAEIFRKEGHVTTQPPFGNIYSFSEEKNIMYEAQSLLPVSDMCLCPTPTHIITLNHVIFSNYYWCRVRVCINVS